MLGKQTKWSTNILALHWSSAVNMKFTWEPHGCISGAWCLLLAERGWCSHTRMTVGQGKPLVPYWIHEPVIHSRAEKKTAGRGCSGRSAITQHWEHTLNTLQKTLNYNPFLPSFPQEDLCLVYITMYIFIYICTGHCSKPLSTLHPLHAPPQPHVPCQGRTSTTSTSPSRVGR